MVELTHETRARLDRVLNDRVLSVAPVAGGYTPAARWLVKLGSRGTLFAKMGTTAMTAEALRLEWAVYQRVSGPFMPQVVAWDDDPAQPILVLEDLSGARWPPPWDRALVDEVRTALDVLHACSAPLPGFAQHHGALGGGWQDVAEHPEAFLGLGLASTEWLNQALPVLIRAAAQVELEGADLLHFDVRSDNLCQASRGIVLVDWNCACRGNGALDTGFWLPSLEAEGGPLPEEILADRPDIAAWVSGFFAARAGLPVIPDAPRVRMVQRQQLVPALRWAARELGLPMPAADG